MILVFLSWSGKGLDVLVSVSLACVVIPIFAVSFSCGLLLLVVRPLCVPAMLMCNCAPV